jgi:hypothetical protein
MLNLDRDPNDEPEFVQAVQTVILNVLDWSKPSEVYVVKIDNWFGPKWLAFSHKVLGALAVTRTPLRIPPFVPSRVVQERYFVHTEEGGEYIPTNAPRVLHVRQTSSANAERQLSSLCPHAALFWWSGATRTTGRGSLMAYVPAQSGHDYWYTELTQKTQWRSGNMKGITPKTLASYLGRRGCEEEVARQA